MTSNHIDPPYGPAATPPYGPGSRAAIAARAIAEVAELRQQQRAAEAALTDKHAAEQRRLAREEEARKEAERRRREHQDEALAAVKAEKRSAFFLTHPTAAESSFESYWGRIRDQEAAGLHERAVEAAKAELRATHASRYGGF